MSSFLSKTFAILSAVSLSLGCAAPAEAGKLGVFTSDANGFDTHTFYYDDGQEVTLIDTAALAGCGSCTLIGPDAAPAVNV